MSNGVIKKTLPEITMDADCAIAKYLGPLKMKLPEAKKLNRKLMKVGGIEVCKRGTLRGSNAYRVNSGIEPFMLRTCMELPVINLSNILNRCKINIDNDCKANIKSKDKCCILCKIHITANRCTKRKIEQFLI